MLHFHVPVDARERELELRDGLRFEVFDEDAHGTDELLGSLELALGRSCADAHYRPPLPEEQLISATLGHGPVQTRLGLCSLPLLTPWVNAWRLYRGA